MLSQRSSLSLCLLLFLNLFSTTTCGEQYIMQLRSTEGKRTMQERITDIVHPSKIVKLIESHNLAAVILSQDERETLSNHEEVDWLERDPRRYVMGGAKWRKKNRRFPSSQIIPWGIKAVQADLVKYKGNVTVCIVDSGYDITHPDLPPATGTSFQENCPWYRDTFFEHGTHVAGTIVGLNNDFGVVGVIPSRIKIHMVRLCQFFASAVLEAVLACSAINADVINLSLGGPFQSRAEEMVFDSVYKKGVLPFCSSGNSGDPRRNYPASYDSCVSVAATDIDNQRADFSTHNPLVELSGPGVDVVSTTPNPSLSVVTHDGKILPGTSLFNTASASVVGALIDCGRGLSPCPPSAENNICFIQRNVTDFDYSDVVRNCESVGGIGAVIYNYVGGNSFFGGVGDSQIPAIFMGSDTGGNLVVGSKIKISNEYRYESYDGTSMAAPHVTGVAALVWSNMRECSAPSIRELLAITAKDLGAPGRDDDFGFGLVQAKSAVDYYKAYGCANGAPTSAPTPTTTVRWDINAQPLGKEYIYQCDGTCIAHAEWEITGTCPHANDTILVTVSPKISDFAGFRKGLAVIVTRLGSPNPPSTLEICYDIGSCNITSYMTGACLDKMPFPQLNGTGRYSIELELSSFVFSCPITGNRYLDAIVKLECGPSPMTTTPVPVTTASPAVNISTTPEIQCGSITLVNSTSFTDEKEFVVHVPANTTFRLHKCLDPIFAFIQLFQVTANQTKQLVTDCFFECGFCGGPTAPIEIKVTQNTTYIINAVSLEDRAFDIQVTCDPFIVTQPVVLDLTQSSNVSKIIKCNTRGCEVPQKFSVVGTCQEKYCLTVSPKIKEYHNKDEYMFVKVNNISAKKCEYMGYCSSQTFSEGRCMNQTDITALAGPSPSEILITLGNSYQVNQCVANGVTKPFLEAKVTLSCCDNPPVYPTVSCESRESGYIDSFDQKWYELQIYEGQLVKGGFGLSTCGSTVDTVLSLYEAPVSFAPLAATRIWECDDCGGCGTSSKQAFNGSALIKASTKLFVNVRGLSSSNGTFYLRVTCNDAPPTQSPLPRVPSPSSSPTISPSGSPTRRKRSSSDSSKPSKSSQQERKKRRKSKKASKTASKKSKKARKSRKSKKSKKYSSRDRSRDKK